MKNKVVVNQSFGGFDLSEKALDYLSEAKGEVFEYTFDFEEEYPRHDKDLVKAVEVLGKEASGRFSSLGVVEIDSDKYLIKDYDGVETCITPEDEEWIVIDD